MLPVSCSVLCLKHLCTGMYVRRVDETGSLFGYAGSVTVLPTVLYLTTGVLREMAPKGATNLPPVISAALQCLKMLCSSPLCRDPRCSAGWIRHLQSTLATVIEYSQPGQCNCYTELVIKHFSGLGKAVGQVSVWTITVYLNDL